MNKECQFKDANTLDNAKNKRKINREKCTRRATWIVRQNGKEYRACDKHKGSGTLVRKL